MPPAEVELRQSGSEGFVHPDDWRPRFAVAYRVELQAWIDSVGGGSAVGASAFDGYAATAVAETALNSLRTGRPQDVRLQSRAELYE